MCPDDHPHTQHCYETHKCRCDRCREGNRLKKQRFRGESANRCPESHQHDYTCYSAHLCRCRKCVNVNRLYKKAQRDIAASSQRCGWCGMAGTELCPNCEGYEAMSKMNPRGGNYEAAGLYGRGSSSGRCNNCDPYRTGKRNPACKCQAGVPSFEENLRSALDVRERERSWDDDFWDNADQAVADSKEGW